MDIMEGMHVWGQEGNEGKAAATVGKTGRGSSPRSPGEQQGGGKQDGHACLYVFTPFPGDWAGHSEGMW